MKKGENDSDDGLAYGISCKGLHKKQNVADIAFGAYIESVAGGVSGDKEKLS